MLRARFRAYGAFSRPLPPPPIDLVTAAMVRFEARRFDYFVADFASRQPRPLMSVSALELVSLQ